MRKYTMQSVCRAVIHFTLIGALGLILTASVLDSLYAQNFGLSMTTAQYSNKRTVWNHNETILNTVNVNPKTFGKKWTAQLDGQVYGAPLFVSGVVIGGEAHDVVYAVTEHNLIYALDAETGAELWPMPYFLDAYGSQSLLGCGSISPDVGITGT